MKKILVATYFSTRSDRAIRRATLLAKKFGSAVSLIHVVDDDRPRRIVDAERDSAAMLLSEQARSVREINGVDCSADVVLGTASEGILKAAESGMVDILVVGPHRHHAFLDVFVGTTAAPPRTPIAAASASSEDIADYLAVAEEVLHTSDHDVWLFPRSAGADGRCCGFIDGPVQAVGH
jgi:nucleotide-binding universal stress UspA family protein